MVVDVDGQCKVGLIDFGWAIENDNNEVAHPLHLGGYYRAKDRDSDLYTLGSMLMEQWYDLPYIRRIAKVLRSKEALEPSGQKQALMDAKKAGFQHPLLLMKSYVYSLEDIREYIQ